MKSQGIKGPSYGFFHGNTKEIIKIKNQTSCNAPLDLSDHDIFPRLQPRWYSWMKLYGNNFLVWNGTQPRVVVTEPDLIKEILVNRNGTFPKTKREGYLKKLLGDGIVVAEGEKWLKLRKLANHAFHGECLKLTTHSLLTWSVLLLAIHPDWQEKARTEVLQLFGRENPNLEGVARLKTVNMIIHETLRLYNPVTLITRRTEGRVKLGKFKFPANVELAIPPLALHRNTDIWGQDAHLFKPERFAEGLAKATKGNPMAFLAFGFGPRICVGLNFASYEAKIALSVILQRYKFTLSPNYVHSPFLALTVQPQHGVQVLLQPL